MIPVVFAPSAEKDITDIGEYIRKDNPQRAETFVEELIAKAEAIGHMPERYPKRSNVRPGLRVAVHAKYLIFFQLRSDSVEIVRVIHGARDLYRAFRKKQARWRAAAHRLQPRLTRPIWALVSKAIE